MPDSIEYPMRRAVRDGREAVDDMLPNKEQGTVNDQTQGASDGMLDGNQGMTKEDGTEKPSATSENGGATTDQEDGKANGMTTAAIVIACLAAVAIIVLIFIAIPKSKAKPGGTGKKN